MIWGLRKPVEARGNGTKAPAAWAQIIDDYMLTLAAAGQPPTTSGIAPNPIGSDGQRPGAAAGGLRPPMKLICLTRRNVLCLNRNHLFRSIRLRFAHNALPTQRNLPNWLVREQLMEAIKANLLSHQIGSSSQRSRYWSRFVTPAGS